MTVFTASENQRATGQHRGWPTFSAKGQLVTILGFAGPTVSVAT